MKDGAPLTKHRTAHFLNIDKHTTDINEHTSNIHAHICFIVALIRNIDEHTSNVDEHNPYGIACRTLSDAHRTRGFLFTYL